MQSITQHQIRLLGLVLFLAFLMLPQTAYGTTQTPEVPEAKLESVAKAYIEVVAIQEEYGPRIEAAQSPEEAQQIQQVANQEMVEAIDAEDGVTLDEYNTIIQATQTDDELAARLNEHIQREIG
jgi:sugar phosphate isomerase/epimerase